MSNKMNKEKWLYTFILLNPIYDILSSLFNYYGFSYSLSTLLRPIIPLLMIIYIFFTDRTVRKKLLILGSIYVSYVVTHLYLYNNIKTGISYGNLLHEFQYLINYTYLIFTFLLFLYIFFKRENKLKDTLFYNILFYIVTIYISIITNTSFPSYVEGIGYRGWFNTSGAVGSILIISLFVLLPYLVKKEIKVGYKYFFIFIIAFYLCFLIGSRVGLYGSVLAMGSFILYNILFNLFKRKKIRINKKNRFLIIGGCLVIVIMISLFGSYTLERRLQLDNITDKEIHIAYDLMDIRTAIINNTIEKNYMSNDQIRALHSLYEHANRINLPNVDMRKQQLIYHTYLYQYQKSVPLKLFGNGYLANFGALTLEMEGIALLFNFGIIGFVLYAMPFLSIFIYALYIGVQNIRKIDVEYMMYISGVFISYAISLMAGHVYFNTSVMPVIIIAHVLLLNKVKAMKGELK